MPRVRTTPLFWDCECEEFYIHDKDLCTECSICGTHMDDQPDSRISEVRKFPAYIKKLQNSRGNWGQNRIQFPRLLCEINAVADRALIRKLADNMDLSVAQVEELFERADKVFERVKRREL